VRRSAPGAAEPENFGIVDGDPFSDVSAFKEVFCCDEPLFATDIADIAFAGLAPRKAKSRIAINNLRLGPKAVTPNPIKSCSVNDANIPRSIS